VIVEAIFTLLLAPFTLVLSIIPSPALPAIIDSAADDFTPTVTIGEYAHGFGFRAGAIRHVLPFDVIFPAISAVAVVFLAVCAIRIGQKVLSLVTGGGGAT